VAEAAVEAVVVEVAPALAVAEVVVVVNQKSTRSLH
jgi:hypothetical protein